MSAHQDRVARWCEMLQLNEIQGNPLDNFTEEFKLDHPDQQKIRQDCEDLKQKQPAFKELELRNILELLLTYYCKQENLHYTSGMHEVLAPFFLMGFQSLTSVYTSFHQFQKKLLPRTFAKNSSLQYAYQFFRLLLLYHDPMLCSQLDGRHILPQSYAESWFKSLFAGSLEASLLIAFWEFILSDENPTLPYFFALVITMKKRDVICDSKKSPANTPSNSQNQKLFTLYITEFEELEQLCKDAIELQSQTPQSFIDLMEEVLCNPSEPSAQAKSFLN